MKVPGDYSLPHLRFDDDFASQVRVAYQDMILRNELPKKDENYRAKSSSLARSLRNEGNLVYTRKNDNEALLLYTESISVAVPGSEELALAFANRSAVLCRMGKYRSSLLDVNRALQGKYPESLKPKLASRKKFCVTEIERKNCHNSAWQDKLDPELRNNPNDAYFIMRGDKKVFKVDQHSIEPDDILPSPPAIQSPNKFLPGASSKIQLCYEEKWGRHIIATEDISPGEILVVEKSFASALQLKCRFSHCSFCLVRCDALIPCQGCSMVMYCGDRCRLSAEELYHRVECEMSPFFAELLYSDRDLLALRLLLIGTRQGKDLEKWKRNKNFQSLFGQRPKYSDKQQYKCDYLSICNLEIDLETLSKNPEMKHSVIYGSVLMLHLLKETTFFNATNRKQDARECSSLTDAELFAGSLLLNHFFVLRCNGFHFVEHVVALSNQLEHSTLIACGINSLLSLVNHSCDSNASIVTNKDGNIMFTHQPISAGEQVFISYGAQYYRMPLRARRAHLSNFGFRCRCDACIHYWPLYNHLPFKNAKYLSDDVELNERLAELSQRNSRLRFTPFNSFDQYFNFVCEFRSVLDKTVGKPWKEIVDCQSGLEDLMILRYGYVYWYD